MAQSRYKYCQQSPRRNEFLYNGRSAPFSHMYSSPIVINGGQHPTVEHAYHIIKTKCAQDYKAWKIIQNEASTTADPFKAKSLSNSIQIYKKQWDAVKFHIMKRLDFEKFLQNDELRKMLLDTGNSELRENVKGDKIWGIGHDGQGRNEAGKILMQIRGAFQNNRPLFSPIYIVGDSLVKHVEIPNAETISISGANADFVTNAACHLIGPNTQFLFIVAGTNDLIKRDKSLGSTNKIARDIMKWAVQFEQFYQNCHLIISTIFPRIDGMDGPQQQHFISRLPKYYNDLKRYKAQFSAGNRVHIFNAFKILNYQNHLHTDGLHLSTDGSTVLSANIYNAINSIHNNMSHPCLVED